MGEPNRRGLFALFAGAATLALMPKVFGTIPVFAEPIEYVPWVAGTQTSYGLGYLITRHDIEDSPYSKASLEVARALDDARRTVANYVI